MAGNYGSLSTPSGGVNVAKDGNHHTILQLAAPSSVCDRVTHFSISGQGISPTDPPPQIRVLRQTAATGTATNNPPVQLQNNAQALTSTGRATFTAEPTAGNVLWENFMHPQLEEGMSFAISQEIIIPGGGTVGIEITVPSTSSAALNVNATILFEE